MVAETTAGFAANSVAILTGPLTMTEAIILDNQGNELPARNERLDELVNALDQHYPDDAPHIVLEPC
jgi:hypothetical protein